jgi:hypothetical protein
MQREHMTPQNVSEDIHPEEPTTPLQEPRCLEVPDAPRKRKMVAPERSSKRIKENTVVDVSAFITPNSYWIRFPGNPNGLPFLNAKDVDKMNRLSKNISCSSFLSEWIDDSIKFKPAPRKSDMRVFEGEYLKCHPKKASQEQCDMITDASLSWIALDASERSISLNKPCRTMLKRLIRVIDTHTVNMQNKDLHFKRIKMSVPPELGLDTHLTYYIQRPEEHGGSPIKNMKKVSDFPAFVRKLSQKGFVLMNDGFYKIIGYIDNTASCTHKNTHFEKSAWIHADEMGAELFTKTRKMNENMTISLLDNSRIRCDFSPSGNVVILQLCTERQTLEQ